MNAPATPEGALLRRCFDAALDAVRPARALGAALAPLAPASPPSWVISVGKAAPGMAGAIVDWLAAHGREPAGGIVVGAEPAPPVHRSLQMLVSDHPIPGARSAAAAAALAATVDAIPPGAVVHVAISGGTSSLIAGPLPGLDATDVTATFTALLSSGLDIEAMNAVRKRVSRWTAGRLAAALRGCEVHGWIISDVMGNDLGSIGSGPCTPDRWTSADVTALLDARGLRDRLPAAVQRAIMVETPKPGRTGVAEIIPVIVADNQTAVRAAADEGRRSGTGTRVIDGGLHGDVMAMGEAIAATFADAGRSPCITIWGGETTVTITGKAGLGGRSQEMALLAARALARRSILATLLCAGTDGRDGNSDAAGAIVNAATWHDIAVAGRDPARDLATHDSYRALDAAGALLRTGMTGTNVADLALGLSGSPA